MAADGVRRETVSRSLRVPARVFLVSERDTPTVAYFLRPSLEALGCPVVPAGRDAVAAPALTDAFGKRPSNS